MEPMNWQEVVTSLAGLATIPVILYLGIIDGLSKEVILFALAAASGLGGYPILRSYLRAKRE